MIPHLSRLGILAVCLCMTACADTATSSRLSAPAPLYDRQAGEGRRLQEQVATQAGRPVRVGVWFALRGDCSLQDYFRVTLVFPPAHGRVDIGPGRFKPNYPVDSYRHDCNSEARDGIAAFYRPADGFTGTDSMTLRIEAPTGKAWTTDVVAAVL